MQSPLAYNLPHDQWRPNQFEAYEWCNAQNGIVMLEAPTGSGKTGIATALAYSQTVTTLVKTKNLQSENYGNIYGYDVLYGRSNYDCVHPQAPSTSAADCIYSDSMFDCSYAGDCPYLLQKKLVQGSPKASLNYSYWMSARWPRQDPPQVLVLDEADEASEIVTGWSGTTITEKQRMEWNLPDFPRITGFQDVLSPTDPTTEAIGWLEASEHRLYRKRAELRNYGGKSLRKCDQLWMKIKNTLDSIKASSLDWYIRSGPTARILGNDVQPGFIAKPLTARFHWPNMFNVSPTVLMMSATIGNPDPLARELGIDEYKFKSVESQWPPEMRQIIVPKDTPRIGAKAEPSAYELQADLAAELIHDRPGDWFGIVLVTSKYEARNVTERLASRGLDDRVWCLPERKGKRYIGTNEQTELWRERKLKVPGSILVSWNHWRGYDGLGERILMCMKTPYPAMGARGSYENERMRYDGKLYHWRTANLLAQGVGRTRRGREEDYGNDNGLVAILDGNWTRIRKFLPRSVLEAVVH